MRFGFSQKFKVVVLLLGSMFALNVFAASGGSSNESGDAAADELRIGMIVSLTGPAAPFGIPERDTVTYLVEQANKNGGVDGHKVMLFVEDDQSSPTVAAKIARVMVLQRNVDVIIGPTTGSMSFAVGPIAARYKVPFLAPQGTVTVTDKDTGFYDWIFRSSFTDKGAIPDTIDYMKKEGYKRVALFFQRDAYGQMAKKLLTKLVGRQASGIEFVAVTSAPLGASNLSVQATKLMAANPDVILVWSDSVAAGASLVRALQRRNATAPIIVSGGMTMQAFIDAAGGGGAEGVVSVGGVGWDKPTPQQAKFIEGYGQPKGFSEALAGTGFLAIKYATQNIEGEITGPKMRDALEHICPFPSLIGSHGCYSPDDHDGDMRGATLKVIDGEWVTIDKSFTIENPSVSISDRSDGVATARGARPQGARGPTGGAGDGGGSGPAESKRQ